MRLLPLIAATYFMVSGGPYGLEDIVGQAGYGRALLLLCVVPFFWSLPTALMIGELASALPEEGGFYIWVARALGRFWGFQEAWLSLSASIFDMAIYPALAVAYISQLYPALAPMHHKGVLSLAMIVLCVLWNLRGAYSVGQGSLWMLALLSTPFLAIIGCGLWHIATYSAGAAVVPGGGDWVSSAGNFAKPVQGSVMTAMLFVLWNTMGWDNASTIAREVDDPRKNYIRAMLASVLLVTASYIVPIAVVALTGIPAATFVTGSWVAVARMLALAPFGSEGASWLALAVVVGGALTALAIFNALTLSYARIPAAMASDGLLPRIFARRMKNGVPWVSVLVCAAGWALALGLNLTRLLELDIMLYGLALILEFIALVVLRVREPNLVRPYRVPGGLAMAVALGVGPTILVCFAMWAARGDHLTPHLSAIALGSGFVLAGLLLYPTIFFRKRSQDFREASIDPFKIEKYSDVE